MTRHESSSANGLPPAYQVDRPRASDAIGLALRDAYDGGDPGLPDDMRSLLQRLNAADTRVSH